MLLLAVVLCDCYCCCVDVFARPQTFMIEFACWRNYLIGNLACKVESRRTKCEKFFCFVMCQKRGEGRRAHILVAIELSSFVALNLNHQICLRFDLSYVCACFKIRMRKMCRMNRNVVDLCSNVGLQLHVAQTRKRSTARLIFADIQKMVCLTFFKSSVKIVVLTQVEVCNLFIKYCYSAS